MLFTIFQASADALGNATLSDPAAIPAWLHPFATEVYAGISKLSWYVGGIFGLYLLFLLFNYLQRRQLNKRIAKIEKDIAEIKNMISRNQANLDIILKKIDQNSSSNNKRRR